MNTLYIILGIFGLILGLIFYFSLFQVAGRADDKSEAQYQKLQEQSLCPSDRLGRPPQANDIEKGGGQSENDST